MSEYGLIFAVVMSFHSDITGDVFGFSQIIRDNMKTKQECLDRASKEILDAKEGLLQSVMLDKPGFVLKDFGFVCKEI